METRKLLQEIKGVFKSPKRDWYIGKITHGTPYFNPCGFSSTIIKIRKLKLNSDENYQRKVERYPHLKDTPEIKFSNLPMVRRSKDWIVKIFGNYYWIQIGRPFAVVHLELGWKDKFDSPRFEWCPGFQIWFFGWQYCTFWHSPDGNDDKYYEQVLWWLEYSNKDIIKAEKTWGWRDFYTKKSTWKKEYLIEND